MLELLRTAELPHISSLPSRQSRRKFRNCHRVRSRDKRSTRDEDRRTRPTRVQPRFDHDEYWLLCQAKKIHRYSLAHWAYRFLMADAQLKLGLITPAQFVEIMRPRPKGAAGTTAAPELPDYQI